MTFESLKKPSEFSKVYKRGKSYADKNIVIYYMPNQLGMTRVGFSISKKVGNAVVRNRVRRFIKESLRVNFTNIGNYDLVFVARVRSSQVDYHEITRSLKYIFKKISI
jgi:ribonuclease P protein component